MHVQVYICRAFLHEYISYGPHLLTKRIILVLGHCRVILAQGSSECNMFLAFSSHAEGCSSTRPRITQPDRGLAKSNSVYSCKL